MATPTKKKPTKPAKPSVKKTDVVKKDKRKFFLIGLLIIVVGWFGIVQPIRVHQEKARFEKAATELETTRTQIESKIGKADSAELIKGCVRKSRKYEKEPIVCFVNVNLHFDNDHIEDANKKLGALSKHFGLGAMRRNSVASEGSKFVPKEQSDETQIFSQDYREISGLDCGISYNYPDNRGGSADNQPDQLGFGVSVSCSSSASTEHYPLR